MTPAAFAALVDCWRQAEARRFHTTAPLTASVINFLMGKKGRRRRTEDFIPAQFRDSGAPVASEAAEVVYESREELEEAIRERYASLGRGGAEAKEEAG